MGYIAILARAYLCMQRQHLRAAMSSPRQLLRQLLRQLFRQLLRQLLQWLSDFDSDSDFGSCCSDSCPNSDSDSDFGSCCSDSCSDSDFESCFSDSWSFCGQNAGNPQDAGAPELTPDVVAEVWRSWREWRVEVGVQQVHLSSTCARPSWP